MSELSEGSGREKEVEFRLSERYVRQMGVLARREDTTIGDQARIAVDLYITQDKAIDRRLQIRFAQQVEHATPTKLSMPEAHRFRLHEIAMQYDTSTADQIRAALGSYILLYHRSNNQQDIK